MSEYQQWFYLDSNKKQLGPVTSDQLSEFVVKGVITQKTLIWTESLTEWIPAAKVGGLFQQKPSIPEPKKQNQGTHNPPIPTGIVSLTTQVPTTPDSSLPPGIPSAKLVSNDSPLASQPSKTNDLTVTQALIESQTSANQASKLLNTAGIPMTGAPSSRPQPCPVPLNTAGIPISAPPTSPQPNATRLNTAGIPINNPPLASAPTELNTAGVPIANPLPSAPAQLNTAGVPIANPLPSVPTLLNTAGVPIANPLPSVPALLNTAGFPIANPLPSAPAQLNTAGVPISNPLPSAPALLNTAGVPINNPLPSTPAQLNTTGAPVANSPIKLNTAGVPLPNTPPYAGSSKPKLNTSGFPIAHPAPSSAQNEPKPLAKVPLKLSDPNPDASRPNPKNNVKIPDSVIPDALRVDRKPTNLQELLEAPPSDPKLPRDQHNPDAPTIDTEPIQQHSQPLRRQKIDPKFNTD